MSYYFPHTHEYDSDLGFLIKSYQELKNAVEELLGKIGEGDIVTTQDLSVALQPIIAQMGTLEASIEALGGDITRLEGEIPEKTSELQNDSNFVVGPLKTVNNNSLLGSGNIDLSVSGSYNPINITDGVNGVTYANGVWSVPSSIFGNWDDVPNGQFFFITGKDDSSTKKLKVGTVDKNIHTFKNTNATNQYGAYVFVVVYANGELTTTDYNADANYFGFYTSTSASTKNKVVADSRNIHPTEGQLFEVTFHYTNSNTNPTVEGKPVYVNSIRVGGDYTNLLALGTYLGFMDEEAVYLSTQGLPPEYLATVGLNSFDNDTDFVRGGDDVVNIVIEEGTHTGTDPNTLYFVLEAIA